MKQPTETREPSTVPERKPSGFFRSLSRSFREATIMGTSPLIPWALSIRFVRSTTESPLLHFFSYPVFLAFTVLFFHRLWAYVKNEWQDEWQHNPLVDADDTNESVWKRVRVLSRKALSPDPKFDPVVEQPREPVLPYLVHWFWSMFVAFFLYLVMFLISAAIVNLGYLPTIASHLRNSSVQYLTSVISINQFLSVSDALLEPLLPAVSLENGIILAVLWTLPFFFVLFGTQSLYTATDEGYRRVLKRVCSSGLPVVRNEFVATVAVFLVSVVAYFQLS